MNVCTSLARGLICPLLFPEHLCVDQEPDRLGRQPQLTQPSSLLGITCIHKSKVMLVTHSPGWHRLPHCVLSHLHSAMEMQYFSSLLWEIQYTAINTYQLGRNFPADFSLCPDHKSLNAAAPGTGNPALCWYLTSASASASASWMLLHCGERAERSPAWIPLGEGVSDAHAVLDYPNHPQHLTA